VEQAYTLKMIIQDNEIFVFASDLAGVHNSKEAKLALKLGAQMGIGEGLQGQTYAIPIKNRRLEILPLGKIQTHVNTFIQTVKDSRHYTFILTTLCLEITEYSIEDIAPLFEKAKNLTNLIIPHQFRNYYENT